MPTTCRACTVPGCCLPHRPAPLPIKTRHPALPHPTPQRDRVLDDVATHYYNLATMFRREQYEHGTAWRDVEAWRQKLVDQGEYQWINFREQKYLMRLQHEAEALEKLTQ